MFKRQELLLMIGVAVATLGASLITGHWLWHNGETASAIVEASAASGTLVATLSGGIAALWVIRQSRNEYAAGKPPKVTVWSVYADKIKPNQVVTIHIDLINEGMSPARLRQPGRAKNKDNWRSTAFLFVTDRRLRLPRPGPPHEALGIPSEIKCLRPGEYYGWQFQSPVLLSEDQYKSLRANDGKWRLYILGTIKYGNGNTSDVDAHHRTLFCRRYDHKSRRFRPVEDEAYEHQG